MHRKLTWIWFLWGLGSQLQIVASLSMTELAVVVFGPIFLIREWPLMKRHGITKFFWFAFLVVIGCMVASLYNHTPPNATLRGVSATCIICLAIPVAHYLLRTDPDGFKWSCLGGAFSSFLCTFVFQKAVEVNMYAGGVSGEKAVESIMGGPIFWISRLSPFVNLPSTGWYLQTPWAYSILAPLFMAAFSMLTTTSGRSATLSALGMVALCLIGGKRQQKMKKICKHFWRFVAIAVVGIGLTNIAYRYAAEHNLLGEKAREKYEGQTKRGKDVLSVLMGGRGESFVGLFACIDNPLIGFGPWARDDKGYYEDYLAKYGVAEDYEVYLRGRIDRGRMGISERVRLIPAHSHIIAFWLWYGIFGLVFWIYVIFVLLRYLRQDCYAIPHWFFWVACSIPAVLWHIFFSPMGTRTGIPMLIVACLIVRQVRLGRFFLPLKMQAEIYRHGR